MLRETWRVRARKARTELSNRSLLFFADHQVQGFGEEMPRANKIPARELKPWLGQQQLKAHNQYKLGSMI
jgi:hypothetical protein